MEEILESVITWYNVYTYILMSHKLISKVQADYWESDYDVKSISPNIKKMDKITR